VCEDPPVPPPLPGPCREEMERLLLEAVQRVMVQHRPAEPQFALKGADRFTSAGWAPAKRQTAADSNLPSLGRTEQVPAMLLRDSIGHIKDSVHSVPEWELVLGLRGTR
jgi:hypothetical protein